MISVKFDSIGFMDSIHKAIANGVKESIEKTIRPFEGEIRRAGGKVTVEVPKDLKNIELQFKDLPEELVLRIRRAFN